MPPQTPKKGLQNLPVSNDPVPDYIPTSQTYSNTVDVPAKYQPLSEQNRSLLPQFLAGMKVNIGKSSEDNYVPSDVAHVYPFSPNTIHVDTPGMFDSGVLSHETTHVFQHTLQNSPYRSDYDYGELKGLQNLRNSGKTINALGNEQQAAMVEEYQRLHEGVRALYQKQGFLTPEQSKSFEDQKAIYEPFIKQLVNQPTYDPNRSADYNEDTHHYEYGYLPNSVWGNPPEAKDLPPPPAPPAPGLPPGYISGITDPSPEWGGLPMKTQTNGLNGLPKKK